MGEYADFEIDRLMADDMSPIETVFVNRTKDPAEYTYRKIVRETPKAWLLEMSGGAVHWFPKKYCMLKSETVIVPNWLDKKMWEAEWEKMDKENGKKQNHNVHGTDQLSGA